MIRRLPRLAAVLALGAGAALVPLPAPAAAAAPPDSTRFLLEQDGLGAGWFSVVRAKDAQGRTVYRGSGERTGTYKVRRFELVSGPGFVPASCSFKLTMSGRTIEMSTTFADGKAITTAKADGSKLPVPEARAEGQLFVLPGRVLSSFAMISDFLAAQDAAKYKGRLKAFSPPLVIDLEVTGLGTRQVPSGPSTDEVRAFELKFHVPRQRGQQTGQTITLVLHQFPDGRFHGLDIPDEKVRAYPLAGDAQLAAPPAAYPEIALKFAAGADSLAGTLTLPASDQAKPGPHGALVFVSGSGPSDRDETVAGFPVFRALAEKLAAAGYASLRYDDRGVEDSGGDYGQVTMDLLARVGVLGHSEGAILAAQIAALVAEQSGQAPWCVVMMAGSVRTGREIVAEQQDHALQAGGFPPEQIERKRALERQIFAYVDGQADWAAVVAMADTTEAEFLEYQKGQVDAPWFKSFLDYTAAPWLRRLEAPVLVLHGELDTQLPPAHGAALRDSLRAAGHQRVSYVPARGVNHLFQVAKSGEVEEYGALKPEFAPGVVERVAAFLAMCDRLK